MIIIILLLYIFTIIDCGATVLSIHSMFVNNAQSIVTEDLFINVPRASELLMTGTISTICSVLAEATMVLTCDSARIVIPTYYCL